VKQDILYESDFDKNLKNKKQLDETEDDPDKAMKKLEAKKKNKK
jgi:hypothetical protein